MQLVVVECVFNELGFQGKTADEENEGNGAVFDGVFRVKGP